MPRFEGIPIEGGRFGGQAITPVKTTQKTEPQDFSVGQMVRNIPGSTVQFVKDVATPILHPIETGKAIGRLTAGVAQKAWPGEQEYEVYADQVGQFIKERYGSIDAFKRTVQNDPIGALADMSMLVTGGAGLLAKTPGTVGKVAQTVQKAAIAVEPVNLTKSAVKAIPSTIGAVVPRKTPGRMYEKAVKFGTTIPEAKRKAMVETALKYKIMPTEKGIGRANLFISELGEQIDTLISEATAQGKSIPKDAIFRYLKDARKKVSGPKIEAASHLKQIDKVAKKFDLQMKHLKKDTLTPMELQEFKQDTYGLIKWDAKPVKSQIGATEAKKAMARAAKESIEEMADVKTLNREQGRLLELLKYEGQKPLERAAHRIENRDIFGIGGPIKIGAGGAVGGGPGAAGGLALALLDHPRVKARLAITLREMQNAGFGGLFGNSILPTASHYGLLQTGRLQDLQSRGQ